MIIRKTALLAFIILLYSCGKESLPELYYLGSWQVVKTERLTGNIAPITQLSALRFDSDGSCLITFANQQVQGSWVLNQSQVEFCDYDAVGNPYNCITNTTTTITINSDNTASLQSIWLELDVFDSGSDKFSATISNAATQTIYKYYFKRN